MGFVCFRVDAWALKWFSKSSGHSAKSLLTFEWSLGLLVYV